MLFSSRITHFNNQNRNMKIRFQLLLAITIVVLALNCNVAQASSRRMPAHFYGSCSARLRDTLHTICGRGGISLLRDAYLMRRYRPRRLRRNAAMLRRDRRDVQITSDFQPTKPLSFSGARWLLFSNESPLTSLIHTAHDMHKERKVKRRVRRQISQECCENACDHEIIRKKYCNFRYG
ncbi:uncharacterized protein LOC120335823 isoform X1 [Styela clava]